MHADERLHALGDGDDAEAERQAQPERLLERLDAEHLELGRESSGAAVIGNVLRRSVRSGPASARRFSATKASSARSACSRQTRSISSRLARAQPFVRIEAPDAFEQALPAQHLVAAGDAAVEVVGDVEEGAVAVGDAAVEREQLAIDEPPASGAAAAALQRSSSSTAPCVHTDQWPSRPPRKRTVTGSPSRIDVERRDEVEHDVVVVAGVERDAVLGARRDDAAHDVERAVAVERRDLDRDDVVDRGEARPERAPRSRPPTAGCR